MTPLTRPHGPLPARVYWRRRILVLASALVLVVGVGSVLNRGSDGSGGAEGSTAVQAAADASTSTSSPRAEERPTPRPKKTRTPKRPPLPQPSGPCAPSDIVVTPLVRNPVAGSDVGIRLKLVTRVSAACTWRVSADSMILTITSGSDDIWSSRECPGPLPTEDVVLRRTTPVWFGMTWSARRSDEECSTRTAWALPGWYHVNVAPLAGEPSDVQFRLLLPLPEPDRSPSPDRGADKERGERGPTAEPVPSGKPSRSPSGAVEPNG